MKTFGELIAEGRKGAKLTQRELAARLRNVGFANVAWRDMTLGVVALHSAWRI